MLYSTVSYYNHIFLPLSHSESCDKTSEIKNGLYKKNWYKAKLLIFLSKPPPLLIFFPILVNRTQSLRWFSQSFEVIMDSSVPSTHKIQICQQIIWFYLQNLLKNLPLLITTTIINFSKPSTYPTWITAIDYHCWRMAHSK